MNRAMSVEVLVDPINTSSITGVEPIVKGYSAPTRRFYKCYLLVTSGGMMRKLFDLVRSWFRREPIRLAIVRRYTDANGSYVGELYMEQNGKNFTGYTMVGASLDTLPLDWQDLPQWVSFKLDTRSDFLAPMPRNTMRVGALDPRDNDRVRRMVSRLPRRRMTLVVQNRFIEYVLDKGKA